MRKVTIVVPVLMTSCRIAIGEDRTGDAPHCDDCGGGREGRRPSRIVGRLGCEFPEPSFAISLTSPPSDDEGRIPRMECPSADRRFNAAKSVTVPAGQSFTESSADGAHHSRMKRKPLVRLTRPLRLCGWLCGGKSARRRSARARSAPAHARFDVVLAVRPDARLVVA